MSDVAAAIRDSVLFADKWPIWKPARSRYGRDIDGRIPLPSASDCARRCCCHRRLSLLHYSFGRRQRRSINNVSSCCRRTARRLTKDIPLHAPSDILPQDRAAVTEVVLHWNSSRSNIGVQDITGSTWCRDAVKSERICFHYWFSDTEFICSSIVHRSWDTEPSYIIFARNVRWFSTSRRRFWNFMRE